jgi:hypothetical protein
MVKFQSTKRLRLAMAVLSLASASAVFQPQAALGGEAASTPPKCDCNNGDTFCKTITGPGDTPISCWKH